jgi:hypothetical protein
MKRGGWKVRNVRKAMCIVTAISLLVSSVSGAFAPARADTAANDLKQIEYKYYFRGKYQQTIEALQTFLARVDLTTADSTRAREVLAASYVLGGAPAMGKGVFARLIADHPSYPGPDPTVFKLEVVDAYAEARSEYTAMTLKSAPPGAATTAPGSEPAVLETAAEGKPFYKKWWVYAGAASLLILAGALGSSQGDEPPPAGPTGSVNVGVRVQ